MSEVYDCTTPQGREAGLDAAARAVRQGYVVVLPTDTVYGIGCDAFDAQAVSAVLAAKGRGREMPPPVLVPRVETVDGLAQNVPGYARALMERFWPGALTVVLEAQPSLNWDLGETNGTVALRMPADELALELLADVGPMAVTSANLTGSPPARSAQEARDQLGESVAIYLEGGPSSDGAAASTILDCTGGEPETLRSGAIERADIDDVVAHWRLAENERLAAVAEAAAAEAAREAELAAWQAQHKGRGAPAKGPRVAGSRRKRP